MVFNEQDKEGNKNMINKYYIDYFNVNLSKLIGSVQKMKIPKTYYTGKNMWLLKRDNLNRGRKIKVLSSLDDIIKEINTLFEQKSTNNLLIQKYLEEPLLYNNRKFDIRIWVLLSHDLKVYVFNEGHLKCCSVKYNLDSCNNYSHLTNYSFQKYSDNFQKYEYGNEVSFDDLQYSIDSNCKEKVDFKKEIFPKIQNIIKICFQSVKSKINEMNREYTFEIFGFDFMIDCNFEPFLIEINTNQGWKKVHL